MTNSIRGIVTTSLLLSTILLTGCGGPFSDYSDSDLRKEFRQCDYNTLSPAGAQRCRNIEKECKVRLEDKGFRC